MADNENDSPAKQIAAELLARDGDKALGIAYEQRRRAEKLGDSAAADAWQRIARAIVLIELERLRRMLDETSGVTGSDTYPAATHVTVAADRDEAPKSDGRLVRMPARTHGQQPPLRRADKYLRRLCAAP